MRKEAELTTAQLQSLLINKWTQSMKSNRLIPIQFKKVLFGFLFGPPSSNNSLLSLHSSIMLRHVYAG